MNDIPMTSLQYVPVAMPWPTELALTNWHRHGRQDVPVSHVNPNADLLDALVVGRDEFMLRKQTRFHRRDIQLFVRTEQRLLNVFGKSGFRSVRLNDISVSGASFFGDPIDGKRVTLRVQFSDNVEFLLPGQLIKPCEGNIHRVYFLQRDQAFRDHLLKSSLELRFQDAECFGAAIVQPA